MTLSVPTQLKDVVRCSWPSLVWAIVIAVFVLLASRYVQASIDDLFIILRYVDNAANGHGLVYNIGERVEGYTCFSWVMILVGLVRLGWPAYWAAKLMGLVCSIGVLWCCYGIGRELWHTNRSSRLAAFLPCLLLVVNPDFLYWSVSGLETPLFAFSVMCVLYSLVVEARLAREQHSERWLIVIAQAIACIIAMLTRPEAIVLLAYTFGAKLVMWRARHDWLRYSAILGVAIFVPVCVFFLWRYDYYGEWLPNTYYAKMGGETLDRLHSGKLYLMGFLADNWFGWLGVHGQTAWPGLIVLFLLPVAALVFVRKKRAHIIVLGWTIVLALVVVFEGGDWMPHNRFLVSALICSVLLVSSSTLEFICSAKEHWHVLFRFGVTAAAILLVALFADSLRRNIRHSPVSRIERDDSWPVVFSRYILESAPRGALAASDIGLIGYMTHYRVIDLAGLVDHHVAQSVGNSFQKDYDVKYVLDQKPEFIVLTDQKCLAEDRLRKEERFTGRYQFVKKHEGHSLYELREEH